MFAQAKAFGLSRVIDFKIDYYRRGPSFRYPMFLKLAPMLIVKTVLKNFHNSCRYLLFRHYKKSAKIKAGCNFHAGTILFVFN